MCGIAGIVNFDGHDPATAGRVARRMADALVHRGPDEHGYYTDGTAALAHRRLSIIDLETGAQPMAVADGQVQIVFNGEIYDFAELRTELERLGHAFGTASDTEVILRAYLEWGESCVSRLNGMFAFAIWDARQQVLVLARDRVGKKPLFYRMLGNTIAFASELKALRAAGQTSGEIDREAVDCYFTLGYVPAPRTIFTDVRKLEAGHVMTVSRSGTRSQRYWQLEFGEPEPRSMGAAVEELEELLDAAVRRRLVSDVPLGAFLSGGIDSSLVVSSMAALASPVRTNTIGFDDERFSELDPARRIADHLQTDHREFVVRPQASAILGKVAWHLDEPFADSSALATWYVCQVTRESVTVALSGDGGDEAFGGYTFRYLPHVTEAAVRRAVPPWLRSALFGPLGQLWPATSRLPKPLRLKSIWENLATSDARAYYRDLAVLREDVRRAVYRPEFHASLRGFTPFEVVQPFYAGNGAPDALARSQFSDIGVYMTDDVLVKVDRMSMAHSLEVRAPLLDHRILEFAARLPRRLKLDGRQGKRVLRELAGKRLPAEIRNLPKRGFSIPAAEWLRTELREMTEALVLGRTGLVDELLDVSVLRNLWGQHLDGRRDHSVFFWGLLMLALWEGSAEEARGRVAA